MVPNTDWIQSLKVAELKDELKKRGQPINGKKADLAERLEAYVHENEATKEPTPPSSSKEQEQEEQPKQTEEPPPQQQQQPMEIDAAPSDDKPKQQLPQAAPAKKPATLSKKTAVINKKSAPPSTATGRRQLTVTDITQDNLMNLAHTHWANDNNNNSIADDGESQAPPSPPFQPELVEEIYNKELSNIRSVKILELSQYLEKYLWPHYNNNNYNKEEEEEGASSLAKAHLMSIVLMVNEKFREGVSNPWACFEDKDNGGGGDGGVSLSKFASLFQNILALRNNSTTTTLTAHERIAHLTFVINAFQSLENELVRSQVLKLVSLPLWYSLSPGRLQLELHQYPALVRHWKHLKKKEAKAAAKMNDDDSTAYVPMQQRLEATFVPGMLTDFLSALESLDGGGGNNSKKKISPELTIRYCEKFAEWLTYLLSQLPTRRFVHAVLEEHAIIIKARLFSLYTTNKSKVFNQLLDMARFYGSFPIHDHTGEALTDEQVMSGHYEKLQQLQRLFFKHWPALRDLALAPCSHLSKRETLEKELCEKLSEDELNDLVAVQLRLLSPQDPWLAQQQDDGDDKNTTTDGKATTSSIIIHKQQQQQRSSQLLAEVLITAFETRQNQTDMINSMPLYPNEDVLFNEDSLSSSLEPSSSPPTDTLALPKLNLQFLTLHDYLLRNFTLFRLEATYEVREDVLDAVRRLGPYVSMEDGATRFKGWSRMASGVDSFAVRQVKGPKVGHAAPSAVIGEICIDVGKMRSDVAVEWEQLRQHDNIFLLAVHQDPNAWSLPPSNNNNDDNKSKKKKSSSASEELKSLGLKYVRGCEIIEVRDADGKLMNDFTGRVRPDELNALPKGTRRTYTVALDPVQYLNDTTSGKDDVYSSFNLVMRRRAKENNFKAVLESIRDLMNEPEQDVPPWLHDILLGYGDPAAATYTSLAASGGGGLLQTVDFKDTFLDADHIKEAFPDYEVKIADDISGTSNITITRAQYKITFPSFSSSDEQQEEKEEEEAKGKKKKRKAKDTSNNIKNKPLLLVHPYHPTNVGPYPQDIPPLNPVRFTPTQMSAILSGVQPGLTMVVGPPGTGKTDTAVQILHLLYHNQPTQRTLVITHSNQALNDIFEKTMERDVPQRYLLRLGMGEQDLDTEEVFSKVGRVNAMLGRRLELLGMVGRLAQSLGVIGGGSGGSGGGEGEAAEQQQQQYYTCETAQYFWLLHVLVRWEKFMSIVNQQASTSSSVVKDNFPFAAFFSDVPHQPLFQGTNLQADLQVAKGCFAHLKQIFTELEEIRPFEVLQSHKDRLDYLLTKQAKIVAMTCTHAAMKRREFLDLNLKFDTIIMEEAAQILEIETFIPLLLQRPTDGRSSLKRVILIGDHHQLPPVIKNLAIQKYSKMDQSLFSRFIRLGTPAIQLDRQGRARPSLAALYTWRYVNLGNLDCVLPLTTTGTGTATTTTTTLSTVDLQKRKFTLGNPGFALEYQFIDVPNYNSKGETQPSPYFYQNLGEAEYLVSMYAYMRLLGYPASSISILTTYNGQKALIQDVVESRCARHPLLGRPAAITTVDQYQGQQNDYVLLSLVRTEAFGHLRDVRRLIVAMSRARLGLYVFGRAELFGNCYELQPTFRQLLSRPTQLALLPHERWTAGLDDGGMGGRGVSEVPGAAVVVEGVEHMSKIVMQIEGEVSGGE